MATRKMTLTLPEDLIRKPKVYAAERDKTVNAVVRELLEEAVSREGRAIAAAKGLLALAERGHYSTVDPGSIRREELYERR